MNLANALRTVTACVVIATSQAAPVLALDPTQVFERASPSVWVVRTYDDAERPVGLGSAVVIGPGRLITNCHVLVKSKAVYVRRENVMYQATLEHADAPRDLCQLQVAKFEAPAVQLRPASELKVGERVFAIGNPKGLEVTLSDGLISGLRSLTDSSVGPGTLVQTSAALSPGSSGGGLFDAEGRLIGITTFGWRDAQNLNIALPTEWISEIPTRAQAALAARNSPQAAATATTAAVPAGYPAPGTVWTYRFTDRLFGRLRVEYSVRLLRVDELQIEEVLTAKGSSGKNARRIVDVGSSGFATFPLQSDNVLVELAPYLLADGKDKIQATPVSTHGYPDAGAGVAPWIIEASVQDWGEVSVPAGTFRALRVLVEGRRAQPPATNTTSAYRFKLIAWYSPDARRLVRLEHQTWSGGFSRDLRPYSDDIVELLAYRPPS
jgi:serine protease Do